MQDLINDTDEIRYVIGRCLPNISSINTSYGEVYLDDELRDAVKDAVFRILWLRQSKLSAGHEGQKG